MKRKISDETIAAIVEDYNKGIPSATIAERHDVSEKTVNRYTLAAGVREAREVQRRTPQPKCSQCDRTCRRGSTLCRFCKVAEPSPEDELRGGRWVPRGAIMVWDGPRPVDERPPAACGTNGGYTRHIRYTKTPPCEACRAAHSAEETLRRQRLREDAA